MKQKLNPPAVGAKPMLNAPTAGNNDIAVEFLRKVLDRLTRGSWKQFQTALYEIPDLSTERRARFGPLFR